MVTLFLSVLVDRVLEIAWQSVEALEAVVRWDYLAKDQENHVRQHQKKLVEELHVVFPTHSIEDKNSWLLYWQF